MTHLHRCRTRPVAAPLPITWRTCCNSHGAVIGRESGMLPEKKSAFDFNVICPVQSCLQKYFCFPEYKSPLYSNPSRPTEGRWPSSSTRGGMRWTRVALLTRAPNADGEIVWSWHPDAGVKFAGATLRATVAKKPGRRGERDISRKPLRGECRVIPV